MFDAEIIKKLNEPLPKEFIKTRQGASHQILSYLPGYFVIQQANKLFGHGNWDSEITHIQKTHEMVEKKMKQGGEYEQFSVAYLAQIRLTVRGLDGLSSVHEDMGYGDGAAVNTSYGIRSSIELATKEAVTDGLKRCLRKYGDQFGLSLYDKDNVHMSLEMIEDTRTIGSTEIDALRALYEARGIDDEWLLRAMSVEGYNGTLEEMNTSWYQLALKITTDYKLEEIQQLEFEEKYEKLIDLMKKSNTYSMLKSLFKEIYSHLKKCNDKDRMVESKAIYDEIVSINKWEDKK